MRLRRFLALQMVTFLVWSSAVARPTVLGVVVAANRVHLNSAAVSVGATVYDGDRFSTEAGGMLLLRGDAAMLRLGEESLVIVRSRANGMPGTEAELDKGTVAFTVTRGSSLEIAALEARIRPAAEVRTVGGVRIVGPKELAVDARRASLQFSYRGETETIAGGKSYRVILDPPDDGPKETKPAPLSQRRKAFLLVVTGAEAGVIAWEIHDELIESPDRP